jgi:HSP20 family protein
MEPTTTYRLAEIQFGRFERVLYLPSAIDVEKTRAEFTNGFLKITLGKYQNNGDKRTTTTIDFS